MLSILPYLLHGAVLLKKLNGLQLVKNSPNFMEPEGSLPHSQVPATCLYPEPAWSSPHPHTPLPEDPSYPPIYAWVSQVALSFKFPPPKPCIRLSSAYTCYMSPHLILFDVITRTILGEEYRSLSSSLCSFLHSPVTSPYLSPNILNFLFSNILILHSSLNVSDQVSHPYKTKGKTVVIILSFLCYRRDLTLWCSDLYYEPWWNGRHKTCYCHLLALKVISGIKQKWSYARFQVTTATLMAQVFRVVKALDDVINNLKTQVSLRPVKVVVVNTKEIWGPKLKRLPLIFLMKRHIQYSKRRDSFSYKIRILRAVSINSYLRFDGS